MITKIETGFASFDQHLWHQLKLLGTFARLFVPNYLPSKLYRYGDNFKKEIYRTLSLGCFG